MTSCCIRNQCITEKEDSSAKDEQHFQSKYYYYAMTILIWISSFIDYPKKWICFEIVP